MRCSNCGTRMMRAANYGRYIDDLLEAIKTMEDKLRAPRFQSDIKALEGVVFQIENDLESGDPDYTRRVLLPRADDILDDIEQMADRHTWVVTKPRKILEEVKKSI